MSEKEQQLETAFKSIALLNQLILESGASRDFDELAFMMLNRTISYVHYDRAVFFTIEGGLPVMRGISGSSSINSDSEFVHGTKRMLKSFVPPAAVHIVEDSDFLKEDGHWQEYTSAHNGTDVLWLPLKTSKGIRAGLWLERWDGKKWINDDKARCSPLSVGYAHCLEHHDKPKFTTRMRRAAKNKWSLLKALVVCGVLGVAAVTPVPLRIVATCEVVAENPVVIASPLNGTVKNIVATPGQLVTAGDILFEYDKEAPKKSLEESLQKVEVMKASLTQSLALAFDDKKVKAQLPVLLSQLKEEQARLEFAQYQNSHLVVKAESAGTVIIDDVDSWTGRPVGVGEQIMQVIDPTKHKVRIWVATSDKISFDAAAPVKVILEARPSETYQAQLIFDNSKLEITTDARACFRAEAAWMNTNTAEAKFVKVGQTGTAILYGDKVPLIYWIMRRPLNAIRSLTGW